MCCVLLNSNSIFGYILAAWGTAHWQTVTLYLEGMGGWGCVKMVDSRQPITSNRLHSDCREWAGSTFESAATALAKQPECERLLVQVFLNY